MRVRVILLALLIPAGAAGETLELSNHAFQIHYDASGIRSLRRTNDVHDTDYISPTGALGRLLIRYRTTPNGDWRELRDLLLKPPSGQSIQYEMGAWLPALAAKATASAGRGVGGLRALNDGLVPGSSEGSEAVARATGPPRPSAEVPRFTWTAEPNEPGSGGPGSVPPARWVQYSFETGQVVSRAEVFWVNPPRSWRLLYQSGQLWREVAARGPYSTAGNAFATIEFEPVTAVALRIEVVMPPAGVVSIAEWRIGPPPRLAPPSDLTVDQRFSLEGDALEWRITLSNRSERHVEVGDLAVPLEFAERVGSRQDIYTRKLLRHALVAGHGSWVYWQRSNGTGPYLVMVPLGETKFEYSDHSAGRGSGPPGSLTPYIHARVASGDARASGGTWRLPISSLMLTPKGSARSTVDYAFRFRWARDFSGVRQTLYEEQKFDTAVVPGMVVPADLSASFSLRTKNAIRTIDLEHPDRTRLERVAQENDLSVYRIHFDRLGENLVTIRYADGLWTTLEFFVTEPLETVIRKRAAFLVSHQQHKDPAKWYVGAFGDWDQKNEILRGPEDRDGLSTWLTDANDDAGNARPAFLASKNVFFPDQTEIDSLELYLRQYLWGGMQMTDTEKYPYAIYGIPNWKVNRQSADEGRNGRAHVWRIYDYPHIIMLYHRMYQIARFYPRMVKYLDAEQYLERAYSTAVAYWTVPLAVENWSANAVGTMNEALLPELIESLEEEGWPDRARTLRRYWESKVERFVNRPPNLYGSEFAFDSTGFESTGAFAKYAMTRALQPDERLPEDAPEEDFRRRVTYDAALRFMNFQLLLNVSDRGWLETTYYQLGSDYRGNMTYLLSYMSQLGGWSILDYAMHFARDPTDCLRLGYAASLSSWALVNSGTERSGYGYWFPSRNNDGATGGGFMPDALGRAWIGKQVVRGAWHYSAEEDVGYAGALRSHATIVARDPVFGEIAYGGILTRTGKSIAVVPRDGLRVRFHVMRGDQRFHMRLDRDGFAKERRVVVADDLSSIAFTLENRTGDAHETRLTISGLPDGEYAVALGGRSIGTLRGGPAEGRIAVPVAAAGNSRMRITRSAK